MFIRALRMLLWPEGEGNHSRVEMKVNWVRLKLIYAIFFFLLFVGCVPACTMCVISYASEMKTSLLDCCHFLVVQRFYFVRVCVVSYDLSSVERMQHAGTHFHTNRGRTHTQTISSSFSFTTFGDDYFERLCVVPVLMCVWVSGVTWYGHIPAFSWKFTFEKLAFDLNAWIEMPTKFIRTEIKKKNVKTYRIRTNFTFILLLFCSISFSFCFISFSLFSGIVTCWRTNCFGLYCVCACVYVSRSITGYHSNMFSPLSKHSWTQVDTRKHTCFYRNRKRKKREESRNRDKLILSNLSHLIVNHTHTRHTPTLSIFFFWFRQYISLANKTESKTDLRTPSFFSYRHKLIQLR